MQTFESVIAGETTEGDHEQRATEEGARDQVGENLQQKSQDEREQAQEADAETLQTEERAGEA